MAGYIGSGASVVSSGAENKKVFDITTNTTSLTGLNYTVGKVHVYHNGVRLVDGTDYTATNSTSITLTVAAVSGDQVVVVSYASYQVALSGIDDQSNATAITIDSSERVMVGGTSPFSADTITLDTGGFAGIRNTSGSCLELRRDSSDGNIIDFQKDGTAVGSIGVVGSDILFLANPDGTGCGLNFDGDNPKINPTNGSGSGTNGVADLGWSGGRFKDAYLSGGIYLGGVGSANKLDDYEEGTFSPIISGGTSAGTVTYNTRIGQYTKVGNLVTVWMNINWSSGNGSGSLMVKGLPFSVINTARPVFNVISENVSLASNQLAAGFSNFSDGIIMVRNITGTGATLTLTYDSAGTLFLTGTYPTND